MNKIIFTAAVLGASAMLNAWQVNSPHVYPADSEPTIIIKAENGKEKKLLAEGAFYYLHESGSWSDGEYRRSDNAGWEKLTAKPIEDGAAVTVKLRDEGNHCIRLGKIGQVLTGKKKKKLRPGFLKGYADFRLFTLKPDLMALRPWKGDIHQHSIRCGHAKEPPHRIPAFGRRAGFDFLALSEHKLHGPSLEAIAANDNADAGMRAFPAEEFHTERASILHAVAVGHESGVNDWTRKHPEEYEKRWKAEMANPEYAPYKLNKFELEMIAKARVLYRIARNECKAKLIVHCHPASQGMAEYTEHPMPRFRRVMFELFDHDAVEWINCAQGGGTRRVMYMNSMAQERFARGLGAGYVSVSDCHSHATHTRYGKFFTVIFAKDCTTDDFVAAVKSRMSVAVRLPSDKDNPLDALYFGPSRLIHYQEYLDDVYWPGHDKLCREQGELMLKLADGDESVRPRIAELKAAVKKYRDGFFFAPAK